jgi:predicted dienelactone hydrolase
LLAALALTAGAQARSQGAEDVLRAVRPPVPRDNDAAIDVVLARKPLAARPRFSYNKRRPLALRLGTAQTQDGVVRQPLSFDAGSGRKPAFWTHPAEGGPWPVVLFSPGSDGTARTNLPDADRLARQGIASLTVAPPVGLTTCRPAADVGRTSTTSSAGAVRSTSCPGCVALTHAGLQPRASASEGP